MAAAVILGFVRVIFHFLGIVLRLSQEKKWHCNIAEMLYTVYFSFSTCASHDLQFIGYVCETLAFFSPFHDRL